MDDDSDKKLPPNTKRDEALDEPEPRASLAASKRSIEARRIASQVQITDGHDLYRLINRATNNIRGK